MKKMETKQVSVTYCDYCKKLLDDYSHAIKTFKDGTEKDFHSMYKDDGEGNKIETCVEKFDKEEIRKYQEDRLDKHRNEVVITCAESCWCWDLEASLSK